MREQSCRCPHIVRCQQLKARNHAILPFHKCWFTTTLQFGTEKKYMKGLYEYRAHNKEYLSCTKYTCFAVASIFALLLVHSLRSSYSTMVDTCFAYEDIRHSTFNSA